MTALITGMESFREFQSFMVEEFHTDLSQTHVVGILYYYKGVI